jgi:hypothetical protein
VTKFFRNHISHLIVIVCILTIASCTQLKQHSTIADCDDYIRKIKTTNQYKTDSSFLSYTVYNWIDSSYGWFGHYNRSNAKNGFYAVHIGEIFYDSAKLKLTAFVFVEYSSDYIDTAYEKLKNPNGHLFDSHTAMGYRDSINHPWKFFELDEIFIGLRSNSLASAENFHKSVFLNRNDMEKRTSVKYFLPCESKFWTELPLWKKGHRVSGFYDFETYMNATDLNKELRPIFNIRYPDSLLKLYK